MEPHDRKTIDELIAEQEQDADTRLKQLKFSVWDAPVLLVFAALFSTVFL